MPRGLAGLSAAALGAALTALALPPASFWPLAWFGLVPLFVALNAARSRREAALAGFVAGFFYHGVVLHWIYATCTFAEIPPPVALAAWAALAALLAVNWALAALVGRWLTEISSRVLRPWIWALVWTAAVSAAVRWTPRISVDLLAYTQGPNHALLQAGAWGGPHLVGFLVAFVNAALAEAWIDASSGEAGPAVAPLSAALALTGLIWAHGAFVLLGRPARVTGPTARVEILQPDIDQYRKWDASSVHEIIDGFNELLARPQTVPPALIVWPETSIPRWTPRDEAAPEAAHWARALNVTHLVGIVAEPKDGGGPMNGVQLVAPDGSVQGFYAKRELVPFGEYVPFRSLIPQYVLDHWLQVLDEMGDLSAGARDQPLLQTPFGPTSVTICYEAMFPRWARRDAFRGARLLINVTNDGWYKNTWGPYQHFAVNALRAVENREWVIRSGNTGISAVIDPWGFVVADLPLGARGRLDVDVPLDDPFPGRSYYSRHGDWFGGLCLLFVALACLRRAFIRA